MAEHGLQRRRRTGTSATAACTSGSTSRSAGPAARRRSATVPRGRRPARRRATAARCPASTATAGPAASCCRDVLPGRARAVRAGQGRSSTRTTCSTPASWSTRTRSTPTSGVAAAPPLPARPGVRLPARRRRPRRAPCTAAPASASAAPTPPRAGGVMCPSYLATRDEKDSTRGRARVLQEMVRGELGRTAGAPGGARRARPVPVLQGLRLGLPDRRRHGDLQVGGAAPAYRRRLRPRRTTPSAGCRSVDGWQPGRRGWSTGARLDARRAAAQGRCRHRPPPAGAALRRPDVPAGVGRRAVSPRPTSHRSAPWVDAFTDHFARTWRPRRARTRPRPGDR